MDNDFWVYIRAWSAIWTPLGLDQDFIMCLSFILFTENFKKTKMSCFSHQLWLGSMSRESELISNSILIFIIKGSVFMNLSSRVEWLLRKLWHQNPRSIICMILGKFLSLSQFLSFFLNTTTAIIYFTLTFPFYPCITKAFFSNLSHNLSSQYCSKEGR